MSTIPWTARALAPMKNARSSIGFRRRVADYRVIRQFRAPDLRAHRFERRGKICANARRAPSRSVSLCTGQIVGRSLI